VRSVPGRAGGVRSPGVEARSAAPGWHPGLTATVSEADFDHFDDPVRDATAFLRQHFAEVLRLGTFPGVEGVSLDFSIARREVTVQVDVLTPELVRLAGALGLGLELSHYKVSNFDSRSGA
jgi:hypothetical protein